MTEDDPEAMREGHRPPNTSAYHALMDGNRRIVLALMATVAITLTGCVERTIRITSDPPGALVHLNDVEIGRTPCQTAFLHYGTYDVRLSMDGYQSYTGSREADTPVGEIPPIDLAAEILPVRFQHFVDWHFTLTPASTDDDSLLERAGELRVRLNEPRP